MVDGDLLCGYSLGRFMPSHNAFVGYGGGDDAHGDDVGVQISIISDEQTGSTLMAEGSSHLLDADADGLIDIGRAPNGDLVGVKRRRSQGQGQGQGHFVQSSLPLERPSRGIGLSTEGARENHFLIERAPASRTEPGKPFIDHLHTGKQNFGLQLTGNFIGRVWGQSIGQRLGQQLRQVLERFSERLSGLTFTTALRTLTGRRRVRLVVVFGAVGALVLLVMLVGLGGDSASEHEKDNGSENGVSNESGAGSVTPPVPQAGGQASLSPPGDLTEADAIAFAVSQVREGKVDYFNAGAIDGPLEIRVVSTMGDVVLVEVSVSNGDKKTIATLLLQKMETGWRTRDVYKEGL